MSKPKKKCTRARKGNRASHFALSAKNLLTCAKCSKPVIPHRACGFCGNYKGSSVFDKVYQKVKSLKPKKEIKKETKVEVQPVK